MSKVLDHCACHRLTEQDFIKACEQGAVNVKQCFKHHHCLPKCNNCISLVREIVSQHQCQSTTHGN